MFNHFLGILNANQAPLGSLIVGFGHVYGQVTKHNMLDNTTSYLRIVIVLYVYLGNSMRRVANVPIDVHPSFALLMCVRFYTGVLAKQAFSGHYSSSKYDATPLSLYQSHRAEAAKTWY